MTDRPRPRGDYEDWLRERVGKPRDRRSLDDLVRRATSPTQRLAAAEVAEALATALLGLDDGDELVVTLNGRPLADARYDPVANRLELTTPNRPRYPDDRTEAFFYAHGRSDRETSWEPLPNVRPGATWTADPSTKTPPPASADPLGTVTRASVTPEVPAEPTGAGHDAGAGDR